MTLALPKILLLAWLVAALTLAEAAPVTFSNDASLIINGSTNSPTKANPYPSSLVVTGLTGQIVSKVTVTLQGFTHTFPSDASILLVSPAGQRALLMAEVGGQNRSSVTNLTLTLDDDAANALPVFTNLVSGAFKPTNGWLDPYFNDPNGYLPYDFPPPAPAGSSNSVASLSVFNGANPDGTWSLFVLGETPEDSGMISNGWSLAISAIPLLLNIAPAGTNVVLSWTNLASGYTLQSCTNLSLPVIWTTNALPPPSLVAGKYMATNQIGAGNRFYRLAR